MEKFLIIIIGFSVIVGIFFLAFLMKGVPYSMNLVDYPRRDTLGVWPFVCFCFVVPFCKWAKERSSRQKD
jgi:hypothetical protein